MPFGNFQGLYEVHFHAVPWNYSTDFLNPHQVLTCCLLSISRKQQHNNTSK